MEKISVDLVERVWKCLVMRVRLDISKIADEYPIGFDDIEAFNMCNSEFLYSRYPSYCVPLSCFFFLFALNGQSFFHVLENYREGHGVEMHPYGLGVLVSELSGGLLENDCRTFLYEGHVPVYALQADGELQKIEDRFWFSKEAGRCRCLMMPYKSLRYDGNWMIQEGEPLFVKGDDFQKYIDKHFNQEGSAQRDARIITAAQEKPEQIQALINFILQASEENDLSKKSRLSKKSLKKWLETNWPKENCFSVSSDKLRDSLATLLRDVGQGKGGYKK